MITGAERDPARAVTFRIAQSAADRACVIQLRDAVYIKDQGRLVNTNDTESTFDRFDAHSDYIIAAEGPEPIGTVKVVPDSAAGLPCDDVVNISELRRGNRVVELGHLMTIPRVRHRSIGKALMRQALIRSVQKYRATHIVGDFFVDDERGLRSFYTEIGFTALTPPYPDNRFKGAPASVVAVLDVIEAARRCRANADVCPAPLHYFFHDYDEYSAGDRRS